MVLVAHSDETLQVQLSCTERMAKHAAVPARASTAPTLPCYSGVQPRGREKEAKPAKRAVTQLFAKMAAHTGSKVFLETAPTNRLRSK